MKLKEVRKMIAYIATGALLITATLTVGCVRVSGETWYVHSAATPENWPELTPIGEVQLKEYPAYRAAVVTEKSVQADGTGPMFMALFRHIRSNDIAMTAPVEMGYEDGPSEETRLSSMAFLYRTSSTGEVGEEGVVHVRNVVPQAFASVGIRGGYTDANLEKGMGLLTAWLHANADSVEPIGPPRYLGYNSPFVPSFMRYGEVQIPVADRW
jgi:hypothetical protein